MLRSRAHWALEPHKHLHLPNQRRRAGTAMLQAMTMHRITARSSKDATMADTALLMVAAGVGTSPDELPG